MKNPKNTSDKCPTTWHDYGFIFSTGFGNEMYVKTYFTALSCKLFFLKMQLVGARIQLEMLRMPVNLTCVLLWHLHYNSKVSHKRLFKHILCIYAFDRCWTYKA